MTSTGGGLRSASGSFARGNRIEVGFRVHGCASSAPAEAMREILDDGEGDRNEDETDCCREEHAADDNCAKDLAGCRACACRGPEWEAAEYEGQRRHDDGPEAHPCSMKGSLGDTLAAVVVNLGKLNDENGVLGGEANQHDETDGREDVVLKQPDVQCNVRTENRDGGAEENAEWQRPARIESSENKEDKEQGECEDRPGGHAFFSLLFLERHAGVVEAAACGHGLCEGV